MNKDDDRRFRIVDRADGFFVHDVHGRFLDTNERLCADLGYSRQELLSLTVHDICCGATPDENEARWESAEPGMAQTFRDTAVRKDGSKYPVEVSLTCETIEGRKVFVGLSRQAAEQIPQTQATAPDGSPFELTSLRNTRHLFDRFQVVEVTNLEQLKKAALTVFGTSEVHVSQPEFESRASVVEMHELGLTYLATTADLSCVCPEKEFFRFQFAVRGEGSTTIAGTKVAVDERHACIVPPGQPCEMVLRGGHRRLGLRITPATLRRKLSALIGGMPNGDITFEPSLDMTDERAQRLLHTTLFLAETLNWSSPPNVDSLALRELEQAVIVAALEASQNSYSRLLQGAIAAAAPHHVRKVEEYIEANWNRLVPIEELVAIAGIGVRTLFRSFNQYRGRSPMQFARLVRLRHARELLSAPSADTTVIGTALACGYANASHFARHYFEAFGERPSQTLARHS